MPEDKIAESGLTSNAATYRAVNMTTGIIPIMKKRGNLIGMDFAEILRTIGNCGRACIGFGESLDAENPALAAVKKALQSPLFIEDIRHAKKALLVFVGRTEFLNMLEMNDADTFLDDLRQADWDDITLWQVDIDATAADGVAAIGGKDSMSGTFEDLRKGQSAYVERQRSKGYTDAKEAKKTFDTLKRMLNIEVGDRIVIPRLSLRDNQNTSGKYFTVVVCTKAYDFYFPYVRDWDFGHFIEEDWSKDKEVTYDYDAPSPDKDVKYISEHLKAYQSPINNVHDINFTTAASNLS